MGRYKKDWPRLLPVVLAVPDKLGREGVAFSEFEFSTSVKREDEGRLPPPGAEPGLEPILTSLKACAPKLTLLAKDGDGGCPIACVDVSSSSMTAGSSPKLFLKSGELEAVEVAMLARRWKAEKGAWPEGLVVRPSPVMEVPLRWWVLLGFEDVFVEGGEDESPVFVVDWIERGLNMSMKEDRRRCWGAGEGGVFWPDMARSVNRLWQCTELRRCKVRW